MTFQDGLEALAKDKDLTGEDWRVWACVMSKLDFENFIHLTQAEIATALQMNKANVSRSMTRLVEKGVILKGPKVGRSHTYRLSSTLGWKGRVKNLQDERKKRLQLVVKNDNARGA